MKLEQLFAFQTVADCGSIRKASTYLFTSPQNVSKWMLSLESELNTQLFERSRSGIRLTSDGQKAYKLIADVLEDVNKIRSEFNVVDEIEQNIRQYPVYIGCGAVFEPLANAAAGQLSKLFPNTSIQLEKRGASEILKILELAYNNEDELPDMAIFALRTDAVPSFIEKMSDNYDIYSLLEDELHLQVPRTDPLASLDYIPFKLLETLPLYLFNDNPRKKTVAEQILAKYGCIPRNVSRTSNIETCSQQAFNQGKYCFVGYPSVEFRPMPNVVYIPLEKPITSVHLMLHKKNAKNKPFCNSFLNYFFDLFGKDAYESL